jgi:hypothetical protein
MTPPSDTDVRELVERIDLALCEIEELGNVSV